MVRQISKSFYTETAHRLPLHDGLCKHLHGHTYKWTVTVEGELDKNGMVMDFSDLSAMSACIKKYDHATVLDKSDPLLPLLQMFYQSNANFDKKLLIAFDGQPTAESMAQLCFKELSEALQRRFNEHAIQDRGLKIISVEVFETQNNSATAEL